MFCLIARLTIQVCPDIRATQPDQTRAVLKRTAATPIDNGDTKRMKRELDFSLANVDQQRPLLNRPASIAIQCPSTAYQDSKQSTASIVTEITEIVTQGSVEMHEFEDERKTEIGNMREEKRKQILNSLEPLITGLLDRR